MLPKCKNSNIDNSGAPKRSQETFPASQEVKIISKVWENSYAGIVKICGKNKYCMHKTMGGGGICANFAIASQTVSIMTIVDDNGFIKMECAWNYRIQYCG